MEQIQGVALQQTLSPQMRQSLDVLQAPVAELGQLVRRELEINPVLEEELPAASDEEADMDDADHEDDVPEEESSRLLEDDWREYCVQGASDGTATEEWRRRLFESATQRPTLQAFLLEQAAMAGFEGTRRKIADLLIGNIDERGYYQGSNSETAWLCHTDEEEVEAVMGEIRQFDPPGVGARNLGECLALQLERRGGDNGIALAIVRDHLDLLARRKLSEIAQRLDVGVGEVRKAAALITTLDPRPGRQFSGEPEQVVTPDVFVEKSRDGWSVRLNEETIPRLRVGNFYKDILGESHNGKDVREYVRDKIRNGKFFIRCIEQRQQTILNIAREIVARQEPFLETGPAALKPMTMSLIAEAVGIHETTVSRAVAGKYLSTPHGLFEMRSFFTSGFQTSGGSVSNKSVKDAVAELIAGENGDAPLNDQQILEILSKRGIHLARRTVAKYRDQLGILPKHLRRKFH